MSDTNVMLVLASGDSLTLENKRYHVIKSNDDSVVILSANPVPNRMTIPGQGPRPYVTKEKKIEYLGQVLKDKPDTFSQWEKDFFQNVSDVTGRKQALSDKQFRQLNKLYMRIANPQSSEAATPEGQNTSTPNS